MSVLDPTDAANAIIAPDASMYLRLEHSSALPSGRISLSSLRSLLAAGILPVETTPAPTGTLPPLLAFTGPVGAPTGTLALTHLGGAAIDTMVQDGHGTLSMPSVAFAYAALEGLGTVGDGAFEIVAANGQQPLNFAVFVRSTADFKSTPVLFFKGGSGVQIYGADPSNPSFAAPATFSDLAVSVVGQAVTVTVDGAQVLSYTGTTLPASGFVGLGSGSATSPQAQIASVRVLTQAQIAEVQAQAAAAAAAAAQFALLHGNPVAHPGADGFAPGIYFPPVVSFATGTSSSPQYLGSGFARGLSGAQSWTILDAAGASIPGLGFEWGPGARLTAYGNFDFSKIGDVPATIHVTDGTTTLTPKTVTLRFQPSAIYVAVNVLLDTAGPNTGYPTGNAKRYLFQSGYQTAFAGGAVMFSDPAGLFAIATSDTPLSTTEAAFPLTAHYGDHVGASFSVAASPAYSQPFEGWIVQEQPAGVTIANSAGTIYDYWQVGDVLFQVSATSDAGLAGFKIVASADPITIGTNGAVTATGPLTAGMGKSVTVRTISASGVTTDTVHTYAVVAGNVLPATNITMAVAQNLDNQVLHQVVGTPAVTGMGTPRWRIIQKEAHQAIFSNTYLQQFTCDPATGKVASAFMLPARHEGHTFTLIATDGPNVCRQTFTVPCAWWSGPTVYVGRGMAALHGAGVGYDHFSDLLPRLCNSNNWPDRTTGVATIIWAADSDPNYYANDCCNGQGAFPANDYTRFGIQGSVRMIAADLNGPRVRIGGQIGAPRGGGDMGGKGFINKGAGDLYMEGFEVSWVLGYDQYHGISGIRVNADTYGDCTLVDCDTHDCDNGMELAAEVGIVTIDRCRSTNCGANYVSSGATHGYYLEGIEVRVTRTHSYKHTNGHCLKIRSPNYTVTDCVLGDGARGTCSQALNIPEGGSGLVARNDFHKGPNAQNPACIGFYEDALVRDHPSIMTLQGNRFSIMQVEGSRGGVGVGVLHFGRLSTVDGSQSEVRMDGNQFYLHGSAIKSQMAQIGNPDPLHTLPMTDTNSTILTEPFALNFTDPRAGTAKPVGPRPGLFISTYDNEDNYLNMNQVQFDPGTEEFRAPVSSPAGTVLATIAASNTILTGQPNPFVAGTVWSITQDPEYFGAAWAPAGAFTLNTAADGTSTQLLLGPGNTAGVPILKLRAKAPNGVTCDWRYAVTLTA